MTFNLTDKRMLPWPAHVAHIFLPLPLQCVQSEIPRPWQNIHKSCWPIPGGGRPAFAIKCTGVPTAYGLSLVPTGGRTIAEPLPG